MGNRLRKGALLVVAALGLTAGTARALDYFPHVEAAGGTGCITDCHASRSSLDHLLQPQYAHTPLYPGDTAVTGLCVGRCHDGVLGPYQRTHTRYWFPGSLKTSWGLDCTVCHNPHQEKQSRIYGPESYLATGASTSLTSPVLTQAGANWTVDQWKGYVILPNVEQYDYTYKILGNTADAVTVRGTIPASVAKTGDTFAIVYGKLLKTTIATPNSGPKQVKLLSPTGPNSFTRTDGTFAGFCEVCHTLTTHFRNTSAGADEHNAISPGGLRGDDCVRCHEHKNGFKHKGGRGTGCGTAGCHGNDSSHQRHLTTLGLGCERCHDMGNFPLFKDGQNLTNTTACAACHQDGAGGAANETGFKANWRNPAFHVGCDGCHAGDARPLATGLIQSISGATLTATVANLPAGLSGRLLYPRNNSGLGGYSRDAYTITGNTASTITVDRVIDTTLDVNTSPQRPKAQAGDTFMVFRSKVMNTLGHHRLVNPQWFRRYACNKCHDRTVDASWNLLPAHTNGQVDVGLSQWQTDGKPAPSYDKPSKMCFNVYCHSDGTKVSPKVEDIAWSQATHLECNGCHGHSLSADCTSSGCHTTTPAPWSTADRWKSSMPMYANGGPGTDRANTHERHLLTSFSCENCHKNTVVGACDTCHSSGTSGMTEVGHIDPAYHDNHQKQDIVFKDGGTYDPAAKTCSGTGTLCHQGSPVPPIWGDSVNGVVVCLNCHSNSTNPDVDDYDADNGTRGKINYAEWGTTGHGRTASQGVYVKSQNPPADFQGNGCWYCHDNKVLHKDTTNPFRLKRHAEFAAHFEKECRYCHMEGLDPECLGCHNSGESLSRQLADIVPRLDHAGYTQAQCLDIGCHVATETKALAVDPTTVKARPSHAPWAAAGRPSCLVASLSVDGAVYPCHPSDATRHKTGAGLWPAGEIARLKEQYIYMGVCLKCHDEDAGGRCDTCHVDPTNPTHDPALPDKYRLGFDPKFSGSAFNQATRHASTSHFGYKHYQQAPKDFATPAVPGVWKGGKFCWDCHDPHGDSNAYMIHDRVQTENDGIYGKPAPGKTAKVIFDGRTGKNAYTRKDTDGTTYVGLCNVCHTQTNHYTATSADSHMSDKICTSCHEHQFGEGHASGKNCGDCHRAKPIPRHEGMAQPRGCTQCHTGSIKSRMDIMGQMSQPTNSHHVQGTPVKNEHCYVCHWEATEEGLINTDYHEGYNAKAHTAVTDAKVDLVVLGAKSRPKVYQLGTTAMTFTAKNAGAGPDRAEVVKVTTHCLSCHSDQNNTWEPFGDCKTPRQYAWDRTSIGAKYTDAGTATWGKYSATANAAKKNLQKAYSAHGNPGANQGGGWSSAAADLRWDRVTAANNPPTAGGKGEDGTMTDTRGGSTRVECFDCHASHGSKTAGVTSSYPTYNNTYNGGNLKETVANKGGYTKSYRAQTQAGSRIPYVPAVNPGGSQCFDCHEAATVGTPVPGADAAWGTPWGYAQTFGVLQPILGYKDSSRFAVGTKGSAGRYAYRANMPPKGGHYKAERDLTPVDGVPVQGQINGLCTPCHDPHGVSPSLGADKGYAVPLLKGTWMTSPYKEDAPSPLIRQDQGDGTATGSQITFGWYNAATNWHQGLYVTPVNNVSLDRTIFGNKTTRITEEDSRFAGLCLRCHPRSSLTDWDGTESARATKTKNTGWKSTDRIHEAVKGWGANTEHSFPCSKCHQAHVSGLPKLMKTNCLDYRHRGFVSKDGVPTNADTQSAGLAHNQRGYHYGYPMGVQANEMESTTGCHVNAVGNTTGAWPDRNFWNGVTPWTK